MKKFTDINQFRNVIREVKSHHDYFGNDENGDAIYRHTTPYPKYKFRGTVKLHGTSAAIVLNKNGEYSFQSRERILSLDEDNYQFMNTMIGKNHKSLFENIEFDNYCAIYGEWCGGSIQGKIALNQLEKMFVIFAVRIDDVWQDMENYKHLHINEEGIYNILQFPQYEIEIDFNQPELVQNKLIELTEEVEKECPVGKYFGVSGVGEGIVWESVNTEHRYIFKVKGEKHQSSKIKKLVSVDVEEIENMNKFVDYVLTESRLNQGIDKLKEMNKPIDMKSTGDYLRWIYNDVIKEESDVIEENQINVKKLGSALSAKARIFWMDYLDKNF